MCYLRAFCFVITVNSRKKERTIINNFIYLKLLEKVQFKL